MCTQQPDFIVFTYNTFDSTGTRYKYVQIGKFIILFIALIFTHNGQKGREFVTKDDVGYQVLLQKAPGARRIIPFIGKFDSGGVDITELICNEELLVDKIIPVSCGCNLEEKENILSRFGFHKVDTSIHLELQGRVYHVFDDPVKPCRETPVLQEILDWCILEETRMNRS